MLDYIKQELKFSRFSNKELSDELLELFQLLDKQNENKTTDELVNKTNIIKRLLSSSPLTPLTSNIEEWETGEILNSMANKRYPLVIKDLNTGKYVDLAAFIFVDDYGQNYITEASACDIVLPYLPNPKYIPKAR